MSDNADDMNDLVLLAMARDEAVSKVKELEAKLEKAVEVIHFVYNSLHEINPSNYDHDDVCLLNDKSVEAIIALSSFLAELSSPVKGETDE